MKFTKVVLLLFLLCVLCGQLTAQEWKTLKDGIEYAEVTKEISGLKVNMNLLRLDLRKVRLDVNHAMDAAIGTEKTSSIATRHGAFAAINAGFFRLDTSIWAGDAEGILGIDGQLLSEPKGQRIQLWINNGPRQTDVFMSRTDFSEGVLFGSDELQFTGINRERKADDLILYTPQFGQKTLTNGDGVEVAVIKFKVGSSLISLGNAVIPKDGFVVSASGSYVEKLRSAVQQNDRVKITRKWEGPPERLAPGIYKNGKELDVTNGVPQLIKSGKIDITWEQEMTTRSFVETRHPRTAVAKLKDGKFLMITVDGRTESSGGIGLQDLAEYLLSLGATDAMNLDGGGSTTMFVDGKVVNHPSDKEGERKVSDAILVTPRVKSPKK